MTAPTQQLECRYTLAAPSLAAVTRAVQDTLDDLAYTQVGRWVPQEVCLTLPMALLAGQPDTRAQQALARWLSAQGYAWLLLAGRGGQASLVVRCKEIKN